MKKFRDYRVRLYPEYVIGEGTTKEVGELVKKNGGTKALVVGYGDDVLPEIYETVRDSLDEAGIAWVDLPGVIMNPRRSLVQKGVEFAKAENVDFILAIGGGSSIDSAKAIAFGAVYDGDVWDFYSGKARPEKTLPVGSINTIAASGSETSKASVITDDIDDGRKHGINVEWSRSVFAIEDPLNTYSVPPKATANGAVDVFSHTFDSFFSPYSSMIADEFAAGLMKTVVRYTPIAMKDPTNYEARFQLMTCCPFSICGITTLGRQYPSPGASASHPLEQMASVYDVNHGAALAVIMPAVLKYFVASGEEAVIQRVAAFAHKVFNVEVYPDDLVDTCNKGIQALENWLDNIGMPKTLTELGLPEDAPETLADAGEYRNGKINIMVPMDHDQAVEFYKSIM